MRAYVFTDKALERQAGRFVWLALNAERPQNAAARKRLGLPALPTFFIVEPDSERVIRRWVGGATVAQLEKILDEARPASAPGALDEVLARAEQLYGDSKYAEAAQAYEQVMLMAPADWPRFGRTLESMLFALSMSDGEERCAKLARDGFARVRHTPSAANVAASGLDCALQLEPDHPNRAEWVAVLEADAREVVSDTTLAISGDDRSGVYIALVSAREDAKDEAARKRALAEWAAFLEGAAGRARTPDERAVYDSHRLSAYLDLGEPQRALPMLEASERDLPDDYNPPARLAIAYKAMKEWDKALAASDRAMAKAYGPRKLLFYQTRADIYAGKGDTLQAVRTLEEAVATAEAFPPGQRSEGSIATLKKKIEGMRK